MYVQLRYIQFWFLSSPKLWTRKVMRLTQLTKGKVLYSFSLKNESETESVQRKHSKWQQLHKLLFRHFSMLFPLERMWYTWPHSIKSVWEPFDDEMFLVYRIFRLSKKLLKLFGENPINHITKDASQWYSFASFMHINGQNYHWHFNFSQWIRKCVTKC